ncbi:MAG: hypothetical protein EOO24_64035, partial [Comamonadaceae bacterium]
MWVYGDTAVRQSGAALLARMQLDMRRAADMTPGLARHSLLVALLIDAGMLAQGLADMPADAADADREETPVMQFATALARCCL